MPSLTAPETFPETPFAIAYPVDVSVENTPREIVSATWFAFVPDKASFTPKAPLKTVNG